jgi:hypothetical protein
MKTYFNLSIYFAKYLEVKIVFRNSSSLIIFPIID